MNDAIHLPASLRTRWDEMVAIFSKRDVRHAQVASARRGDVDDVMPGTFPTEWQRPIVANVIDTTAKELAQVLSSMPTIDCIPGKAGSESAKKFAAKRSKIAMHYADNSRLLHQLQSGCDWFFTFGALPFVAEPDIENRSICIRLDNPRGAYWLTDAYGRVRTYAKAWQESELELVAKFPHLEAIIMDYDRGRSVDDRAQPSGNSTLKVVRMYEGDKIYEFLPDRGNCCLKTSKNPLGRPPVEIAMQPMWDDESRADFDDVMWVWLARNKMAIYSMEAAKKAIQAPIALPQDVQTISFGADAVIRTSEPDKVRRVGIDLPQAAVLEPQVLQQELQLGLNKQASASNFDASIVTGRGIEALNGVFSTRIKAAQDEVGGAIRRALQMCFELDQILWTETKKTITGEANGAPFTETYTPSNDIKNDYTVSVTYGFAAGMDPNRSLVWLLQLRGDGAISRQTMMRALPMEVDIDGESRNIDLEQMEDAIKQGLQALAANLPLMVQQPGMDVTKALGILVSVADAREKGVPMRDALAKALEPPEQEQVSPEEQALQALMGGGAGAPQDPMAAAMGGGGMPGEEMAGPESLQMMLAGLSAGGNPQLSAGVSRQIPAA